MSQLQVDSIKNRAGTGAPSFPTGATVTGVITATSGSFTGNVSIGGTLIYEDVTNVDSVGVITARNGIVVSAGGANITGVVTATGGIQAIGIQSAGTNVTTGVITAINFVGTGNTFQYNAETKIIDISISGGGASSQWVTASSGIHTLSSVGIGTTNPTVGVTSANTAVLAVGIVSAHSLYSNTWSQPTVAVSALDINCSTGNYFTKTIAADSTFTFSNAPSSRAYSFALQVTHTSGTITWPAAVKWPNNTAPTLTTGRTHIFMFGTINAGSTWYGSYLVDYN